jgi:pimeloyl-ACP methyl ester carboxylesterase
MTEKLFVEVRGNGLPITLLHGYPLDHTIWDDVADRLAKDARVITPDLRGQGRSPAPEGVYSMAELAGDVVQVLDKLGVEKTVIGGHSMGGYVSLALAQLYPERINGLVLVGSHAFADSPRRKKPVWIPSRRSNTVVWDRAWLPCRINFLFIRKSEKNAGVLSQKRLLRGSSATWPDWLRVKTR